MGPKRGWPPGRGIPAYHIGSTTRLHAAELWDAILEGKAGGYPADIKFIYHVCGNHLNQMPDVNKGIRALKKVGFYVVHEQFLTPTAKFADIVLPVNTFLERDDIGPAWIGAPYFCHTTKCIDSLYESKTDIQILTELAPRLGIAHYNDKTDEEWLREIAATCKEIPDYDELKQKGYHTIDLGEPFIAFKKQIEDPENNPFATPSGKIEIYSKMVENLGDPEFPPIPKYIEAWEGRNDPLAEKYPLQLISSHPRHRVHSSFWDVPTLRDTQPPGIQMSIIDATARGIKDRDQVRVFNDRGEAIILCWVTNRIMPGVVHLDEGNWFSPDENGVDRGGCANMFTKTGFTPGTCYPCNSALVQVEKA
jgi:anaerobic dimethyl sulfoxide reductase subunit A